MSKPEIALIYEDTLPKNLFQDFEDSILDERLTLNVQSRPPIGPQASLEWFVLPLVAAYISKPYFDGFFGEMGKDHYRLLKQKLFETSKKVMSKPRIEPTLVGSTGKLKKDNPYTSAFSIYADANERIKFKLLIPKHTDDNNYEEIVDIFLDFLMDYHSKAKPLTSIGFNLSTPPLGGLILVQVNQQTKCVEWRDPMQIK